MFQEIIQEKPSRIRDLGAMEQVAMIASVMNHKTNSSLGIAQNMFKEVTKDVQDMLFEAHPGLRELLSADQRGASTSRS